MYVAEKFVSINGESRRAGQPAVFIRFRGCNLACSYCDTKWANTAQCPAQDMTVEQIKEYILSTGITNVTLTGGEPLLQKDMKELLSVLCDGKLYVEIETNGSVDASFTKKIKNPPSLTLDYKTPSSNEEERMYMPNYELVDTNDTVKFVCGNKADLEKSLKIIKEYNLDKKCAVYFSAVFGQIEPREIVEFMLEKKLNGVNLQLQMHKYIWDPNKKGV